MAKNDFFVIYIITKLELGGAQKICLSLFKRFSENGNALLITGPGGLLDGQAQEIGETIFVKTLLNSISPRNFWKDILAFWQIRQIIKEALKKHKNVIVHTHSSKAGIIGRLAAWLAGCKNIVHTIHGFSFNPYQNRIKFYVFWILEFFTNFISSKLIFVSKTDQFYATSKMWVSEKKCLIIRAFPTHIPTKNYIKPKFGMKTVTIGTVSCFKPQKNLFDLLEAIKILTSRLARQSRPIKLNLEIIGDGELREKIEKWTQESKLQNRIKLHGWQQDLKPFFSKIDIFAMSSLWEGLPCAVVEAKLFKLPVVSYDVGGTKEIISNGKNGFLIKPGDKKSLCNKLAFLINSSSFRAKLGAKEYDFKEFDKNHTMALHRKLYENSIE